MIGDRRTVEINISGIPVAGVGGLGLVAIAALTAYILPQTWLPLAIGVGGGALVGGAVILARRRRPLP